MIWTRSHRVALISVLTTVTSAATLAEAQEVQWRVINQVSPTVIPLYNNTPSPFPSTGQLQANAEKAGPSAEELAAQRSLEETTAKVRKQIGATSAVEPQVSGLQVKAVMQGPQGWAALIDNRWVNTGARFRVPVRAAADITVTINQLMQLDQTAGAEMTELLQKRLAGGQMDVTVSAISDQSVTLTGAGRSWQLPVRQSPD